ncbi:MAG: hypothetical protein AB7H93_06320 [Vicinamibacterales bacterium]
MTPSSVHALLAGVVDYAGLFPPAALPMAEAVREYAAARAGAEAWLLGRFVCPAGRLADLAAALGTTPVPGLLVSAIVADRSTDDVAAIASFNDRASVHGARVDTVEAKPATADGVDWLADAFPTMAEIYVEVVPGDDLDRWLARIAARGVRAKIRTGGLTAEAFPAAGALGAFLAAAVRHGVPFKATAGLHHAVRGDYRLTYAPDAASASMYGYLNVLLAAAALRMGRPSGVAEAILTASDATTLTFTNDAVRWGDETFPLPVLRDTRARHLTSFGSCSFREPAEELHALTAAAASHATERRS